MAVESIGEDRRAGRRVAVFQPQLVADRFEKLLGRVHRVEDERHVDADRERLSSSRQSVVLPVPVSPVRRTRPPRSRTPWSRCANPFCCLAPRNIKRESGELANGRSRRPKYETSIATFVTEPGADDSSRR